MDILDLCKGRGFGWCRSCPQHRGLSLGRLLLGRWWGNDDGPLFGRVGDRVVDGGVIRFYLMAVLWVDLWSWGVGLVVVGSVDLTSFRVDEIAGHVRVQ